MRHLSLNSGKSRRPSRRVFAPELKDAIRPFLDNGGGTFPRPYDAYHIEAEVTETGVALEYFKGETPISVCVGTWVADVSGEYWNEIENGVLRIDAHYLSETASASCSSSTETL